MQQKIFSCIESRIKNNNQYYSRFYLGPFSHNKILTYSNTLRRSLLSDLNSINVIAVNLFGTKHEYSSLFGVKESVLDILLNIKQLAFITNTYVVKTASYFAYLRKSGNNIIRAKDLILPNILKCVNNNQYIATLSTDGELIMKLLLSSKSDHSSSSYLNSEFDSLLAYQTNFLVQNTDFLLSIDSNFSSVNKVNYTIINDDELENFSNYLLLEIWTNGAVLPRFALQNSLKTLIELFISFYDVSSMLSFFNYPNYILKNFVSQTLNKTSFVKQNFLNQDTLLIKEEYAENMLFLIDNLNISLQLKFLLKRHGILTFNDLIKTRKAWLIQYCNVSKKSLQDLQRSLLRYNIYLKD
ncbi:RNA polymerase alpha subunit (plastid) [Lotharella oceanica]|uniref:DNA-directed RNA polymerase n=1 Tax=Lotharella oceanica TaxID=641309 RepID=A0A059SLJ2_9EUKA|nr:RNA polymerase alpha subunit [Lotharella oceanica]